MRDQGEFKDFISEKYTVIEYLGTQRVIGKKYWHVEPEHDDGESIMQKEGQLEAITHEWHLGIEEILLKTFSPFLSIVVGQHGGFRENRNRL